MNAGSTSDAGSWTEVNHHEEVEGAPSCAQLDAQQNKKDETIAAAAADQGRDDEEPSATQREVSLVRIVERILKIIILSNGIQVYKYSGSMMIHIYRIY